MKKKKSIMIGIIVSVSVLVLIVVAGVVNDWLWKKRQAERGESVLYWQNELYIYMLSIEGEFRYTPERIEVIEMETDERKLLMDVVLYNEYHKGEELTVEQLLEEYDNFCQGTGTTEGLDAFCEFDRAEQYDAQEHPLRRYEEYIHEYLEECDIKYIDQATMEQLEEAAKYAAKKWREDPGEY